MLNLDLALYMSVKWV